MTPAGMLSSDQSATPGASGYMTVSTNLDTSAVSAPWYAVRYDLNLGTAGDLAASVGFTASLAVTWAPRGSGLPVGVGLKLPGANSASDEITVEGVLKVKAYSITLSHESGAFVLRLNGIALTFLGKSLPPGGSFDLVLFGDPDPSPGSSRLGWYGAYQKDPVTTG
jgi:hypothetical protein